MAEYNDYTARSKYDILRLYDVAISQELMEHDPAELVVATHGC